MLKYKWNMEEAYYNWKNNRNEEFKVIKEHIVSEKERKKIKFIDGRFRVSMSCSNYSDFTVT
jgi:hypothetical protein